MSSGAVTGVITPRSMSAPELGEGAGAPGLCARAGVLTGEVAVTFGAPGEGVVAGDTVNTASRVQGIAEPGHVLVDAATRRLAGGGVGFDSAGQHRLKGRTEPMELWLATWVLAAFGGAQRIDGLEAPLTGRDAELRAVREQFHPAAERHVPRLLLVSGPAGVGKSRLGWEFDKYTDGLDQALWWHRGRCLSYHLAHGLLDNAQHLTRTGEPDAATEAADEARGIATTLRCQPLLDRIDSMSHAAPRVRV
jgi:AAA ATPase domain/Adenylate and Guanylate cyclase catalytic domain